MAKKILILFIILLCSCQQKYQSCKALKTKVAGGIVFSGFNLSDLDTLFLTSYPANNLFTSPISTDTEISNPVYGLDSLVFQSDTLVGFAQINNYIDVKIFIPSLQKTYLIHALYSTDTIMYWQEGGCLGRNFQQTPYAILVNGKIDSAIKNDNNNFAIKK
ncbi:MAG: hypothetical protein P4L41_01095 [Flavipsychrobacter sp.]|nr:hypothetical protein [Flavipsychrobacter sp.]